MSKAVNASQYVTETMKWWEWSNNVNTIYVAIFEQQNYQKLFVDQYYEKLFLKIGENHFKRYITCANYEFLFSKYSKKINLVN